MKDIARECGVSVATVSKVLNDYSDIGRSTRERVRKAAERLGYFPNSSARALKTKRSYSIGVIFTDAAGSGLTHDYFAHILESFKVTAEHKGYDITFASQSISARKTTYLEHCRYRGVDGVAIANVDLLDSSVQNLIDSELPVVTIDHEFPGRYAVVSDNEKGMRELLRYVIGRGHTRIAYLHGEDNPVTKARLASFYKTMMEQGLTVRAECVRAMRYRDVKQAEELTEELLRLSERPTCILYPDDISSIGGINRLRAHGLTIGKDISVAGYDGVFFSQILDPPITTIWQDTAAIGKMAAEKLIRQIENPAAERGGKALVPGRLLKGGSVAALGCV